MGDDGTGADLDTSPDRHAWKDDRPDADVCVVVDDDGRELDPTVEDGAVLAFFSVVRRDDLDPGPDPDVSADRDPTSGVEERLFADPCAVADGQGVDVVALEDRPMTYIHTAADEDAIRVEDQDVPLDMGT